MHTFTCGKCGGKMEVIDRRVSVLGRGFKSIVCLACERAAMIAKFTS